MKRCPECGRDYYDDGLPHCLDDGTTLLEGPASVDEPRRAVFGVPPSGGSVQNDETTRVSAQRTAEADPQSDRPPKGGTQNDGLTPSGVSWIGTRAFQRKVFLAAAAAVVILLAGFLAYRYFSSVQAGDKAEVCWPVSC